MSWYKFQVDMYFRNDFAYAGKDMSNPKRKGFIALAPFIEADGTLPELKGFRSLKAAQNAADKTWPEAI